jgi:hypothetical protein
VVGWFGQTSARRRLAGLVFLLGLVVVGSKLFGSWSEASVPVEIHYRLGNPPIATAIEVEIGRGTARFDTTLVAPDIVQKTRLPAGPQKLEITLVFADGARHTVHRVIDARRDAVVWLDLSREGP